jgi:hypothetical protein
VLPGSRFAKAIMIAVTSLIVFGLLASAVASPAGV